MSVRTGTGSDRKVRWVTDGADVEVRRAFLKSARLVAGEVLQDGGYHFYPDTERVRGWPGSQGFAIWAEPEGDGYVHLLAARA